MSSVVLAMEEFEDCDICLLVKGKCDINCVFRAMSAKHYKFIRDFYGRDTFQQITNTAKSLDDRKEMARTLIEEAICRRTDPIQGCYGFLVRSEEKVKNLEEEVDRLRKEVESLGKLFFMKVSGEQQPQQGAMVTYKNALDLAVTNLPPVHPARLGLVLSISSYLYDKSERQQARDIVNEALLSVGDVNTVFHGGEVPQEISSLLDLIKQKLILWDLDLP